MTPDLSLLSGFARGVLLSLHVRDACLHSGSWLLSGFLFAWGLQGNGLPSLSRGYGEPRLGLLGVYWGYECDKV